jgi:regulator of nucleoside diphosphate kinase
MLAQKHPTEAPPILVAEADFDHLADLSENPNAPGAVLLRKKLEGAVFVKPGEASPAFVGLNSRVTFEDLLSGRTRTVTLVAPDQADIDHDRLSILAPAGAALLGLCSGDAFSWTTEEGRPRALLVTRVGGPG